MSLDIVLVSNSSMDLFPDNKLSQFRVRLPHPITLDPSYRVALTRISWTKSFFNFRGGSGVVHLSDTKSEMDAENKDEAMTCKLLAGFYEPETLIQMLNLQVKKVKIRADLDLKSYPVYSLTNGYLTTEPGVIDAGDEKEYRWYLKFDKQTEKILGFEGETVTRPVFVDQGYTDFYVYSDLVYPSIVGDQTCELLNIIDGQTDQPYGSHCCESWEQPWYHKLAKTSFQEIIVYLRRDDGTAPHFRFGRVCLRLTFKREDDI